MEKVVQNLHDNGCPEIQRIVDPIAREDVWSYPLRQDYTYQCRAQSKTVL